MNISGGVDGVCVYVGECFSLCDSACVGECFSLCVSVCRRMFLVVWMVLVSV